MNVRGGLGVKGLDLGDDDGLRDSSIGGRNGFGLRGSVAEKK